MAPENEKPGAWAGFSRSTRRDREMSRAWVVKLCRWIEDRGLVTPASQVLDYGCGSFDAGFRLAPRVARMDGYDPFCPTLAEVESEARALGSAHLYTRAEDLPRRTYDLILVHSVIQYMNHAAEFRAALALMKECLRPVAGSCIVISDILPPDYPAVRDALEILAYALRNGVGRAVLRQVLKAAFHRRRQPYFQPAFEELRAVAAALGFAAERLPENLTPSRRRYTCVLTLS